jgi:glycosyltransferase involved in cell wall biosynthesis
LDDTIANELVSAGIQRESIVSVNNGVDLNRFYPVGIDERNQLRQRFGLPTGRIGLFVGQLVERKSVKPLLEAWRQLRPNMTESSLLFVGDGVESTFVKSEAASANSRIIFLGVRDDVPDLMRASDVLIVPSRNESFGNVFVEALACGVPVLYGPSGIADKLKLGAPLGRRVNPDSPADIASALTDVLGASSLENGAKESARAIAMQFDFLQVAREYLAIYQSMIEKTTNG